MSSSPKGIERPRAKVDPAVVEAFHHLPSELAAYARRLVGADGAALALEEAGEVVCRGSAGLAPPVGTRLQRAVGLSGECMSAGRTVCCEDAASDPRVGAAISEKLQLGSAVVVCMFHQGKPVGIIECLWSQPRAFTPGDVRELEVLANSLSSVLHPVPPAAPSNIAEVDFEDDEDDALASRKRRVLVMVCALAVVIFGAALLAIADWDDIRFRFLGSPAGAAEQPLQPGSTRDIPQSSGIDARASADDGKTDAALITTLQDFADSVRISPNAKAALPSANSEPVLLIRVEPEYPPAALAQRRQGKVVLKLQISSAGTIKHATVVSGDPLLREAAVRAASKWQYAPARRKGQAVESVIAVTVDFTPPRS